jgi:hypothetical protein
MLRLWTVRALLCASLLGYGASSYADSAAGSADEVIQWNKTLLTIVRTPGAQPATVHPTRSFAIMHAAVYDAVNAIDATHEPYLVRLEHVSPHASQEAADPSYPRAHAAISAGGAFVLRTLFGNEPFHLSVTSEVLPGVVRSFDSFADAKQEASLSRVYAGQHFRSDENAGERRRPPPAADYLGTTTSGDNFRRRARRTNRRSSKLANWSQALLLVKCNASAKSSPRRCRSTASLTASQRSTVTCCIPNKCAMASQKEDGSAS